uniref:Sodium-coupled neutral amino acid transporter 10 n=1 Tax=Culex pipiens TaxID=7175 RepID=A0A8D8GMT3_CULPI
MERNSVQTVTLTNSIIGVGILSMPFCFQRCGVILSLVLLLLSSYITKLICSYMIKSAIISRRKNFEQIAFYSFGFFGKLLVELCVVGYLLGTCVAYYVVVGDLGPQIMAKILSTNETSTLRTWTMIVVTLVCIVPLGLLRNVDSLASVCTASLGFYLCLVLKVMAESSERISQDQWFEKLDLWKPDGILRCLPIFSMALSCQMQLFEVYATMPTTSLDKMSRVIQQSTNICAVIYSLIGFFGYVAFNGHQFSGNILVDFTPSFVSDIIKIGFVLSVAFSFPLAIFPCRASLYSLLYKRSYSDSHYYIPEAKFRPLTLTIVFMALLLGLVVPSIDFVLGLVGSTIGVAVCIIIPAACYMHICKTNISEKQLAQVMIGFGLVIMVLGTYANLDASSPAPPKKYEAIPLKITPPPAVLIPDKFNEVLNEKIVVPKLVEPVAPKVQEVPLVTEKVQPKIEEPITVKPAVEVANPAPKEVKPPVSEEPPKPDKEEIIDENAILKEEKEIAVEEKEKIQQEISELQSAKKELEAQVQNIKEQLVKKNEETQQLVLKKFDEIVEKIDQKASKEKESSVTVKPEEPPKDPQNQPEKAPEQQKDPIVRLLTEQGKHNAKANETKVELEPEPKPDSSPAIEVKLIEDTSRNETDQKQPEMKKVVEAVEQPLPPLPVEQKVDPEDKAKVEEQKKEDDAGSKRDLLSIRNKRGAENAGEKAAKDANCAKVDGGKVPNQEAVEDLMGGKEKIVVDMIRTDVLMSEGKLFKK